MRKREEGRKWEPVIVPSESFQSAMERMRYEAAVRENPRKPEETGAEWAERLGGIVKSIDPETLPYRDPADEPDAEKED